MRAIRVYVDTSVFGGADDVEFAEWSLLFFQGVRQGRFTVLVSKLVLDELAPAPVSVSGILATLPPRLVEPVETTDEMEALADAYIAARVVGPSSRPDALHVAIGTVARAALILSWNFKHIVNFQRIQQFNAVNLANGYGLIDIRSPLEIADDSENEDR